MMQFPNFLFYQQQKPQANLVKSKYHHIMACIHNTYPRMLILSEAQVSLSMQIDALII